MLKHLSFKIVDAKRTFALIFQFTIIIAIAVIALSGCKKNNPSEPTVGSKQSPPVAAFVANLTSTYTGGAIRFEDRSTGEPTAWEWSFGDGSTSNEQNPIHVYSKTGAYTVSLNVSNTGGSNVVTKLNYINIVQMYVQVRHASALTGSVSVSVKGVTYEIQKNGYCQIPVSSGVDLTIWECIWVSNAWSCRWDGPYHVFPSRRYRVIDASSVRWDLTLASD
ncbi:MAG: PKD domain-containing protein [Ignavibacteriales bacterium]|nr:PKD domain-containing protein [Ignavibacteriales bacterium]